MQRMNEALKAAMKMPPRKHKDEPKHNAGSRRRRTRAVESVSLTFCLGSKKERVVDRTPELHSRMSVATQRRRR